MRSNYRRLGKYIREAGNRDTHKSVDLLLGVSIQKKFMPSIANTIGTDMSTYKIVKRNQFAYGPVTSRNGDKISIALLADYDQAIVSQAYMPFEVIDPNELDPQYLMMWFRRPEFDRYARFMSHGSAREIFGWEEMCNTELPLPNINKQKEIVKEYHTIIDRVNLNNQLIQKLEETAQAIYKQWFVDFEFPDEEGKPYKRHGGEMEWNEELEIEVPKGWQRGSLSQVVDVIDGDRGLNYPTGDEFTKIGHCMFLNAGNVTKTGFDFSNTIFITEERDTKMGKGKLKRGDVVFTSRGTVGNVGYFSKAITFKNIRINSGMVILRAQQLPDATLFIYSMLRNSDLKIAIENHLSGSAQPQLPIRDLLLIPILIPKANVLEAFGKVSLGLQQFIDETKIKNSKLREFENLLLSRIATLEY